MTNAIFAYRLTSPTWEREAFTGRGAKLFGGRWNVEGTPVVYTAENRSLAILELLVHADDPEALVNRIVLRVEFDRSLLEIAPQSSLTWIAKGDYGLSREFGTKWIEESRSAVLRVPTAITPAEVNYLINPAHPDFKKIKISKPVPFRIDPRLFKRG